jgi:hypothetical protein
MPRKGHGAYENKTIYVFLDASRKVAARATSISRCYMVDIALNLLQ